MYARPCLKVAFCDHNVNMKMILDLVHVGRVHFIVKFCVVFYPCCFGYILLYRCYNNKYITYFLCIFDLVDLTKFLMGKIQLNLSAIEMRAERLTEHFLIEVNSRLLSKSSITEIQLAASLWFMNYVLVRWYSSMS